VAVADSNYKTPHIDQNQPRYPRISMAAILSAGGIFSGEWKS
jgi:hypothetical protein